MYIDGVEQADTDADTRRLGGNGATPTIGATGATLIGVMDEVHICSTDPGAAWVTTQHTNQNDPSTFGVAAPVAAGGLMDLNTFHW